MARTKISEFSSTPGNNTDIDGINIAEGCAPSGINDAIRELMSQLKDFQAGTAGDSFNGPVGTTTPAAGAFTTLSASGAVTLSGGTANGVPYLNGSKVLTTGSALTFDGTNLVVGGYARLGQNSFLQSSDGSGGWVELIKADSSNNTVINNNKNLPILFNLNSSEQMRLTSTGLGIGTSSPAAKLQVTGGTTRLTSGGSGGLFGDDNASYFLLQASPTANAASIYMNGTGRAGFASHLQYGAAQHTWFNETLGTTLMVLQNSGNLGLGVTPSAWSTNNSVRAFQNAAGGLWNFDTTFQFLGQNYYYNAAGNRIYSTSAAATEYRQTGGVHSWHTAPSGTAGNAISFTQAMTLDASGNLGVGTTSPGEKLTVSAASGYVAASVYSGSGNIRMYANGTDTGLQNTQSGGFITFQTNGGSGATERARIDSSGNLLVGTTSNIFNDAGMRIQPTGSGSSMQVNISNTGGGLPLGLNTTANTNILQFWRSNTSVGSISVTTTTTAYNTSSDYRLKHDIQPMTGALEKVAALKPVTYKWNSDDTAGEGFIAHELAEVVPQAVHGEKDAVDENGKPIYQGIDTSFLVATLTAAIQEQQSIIEQLKADVAALKGN